MDQGTLVSGGHALIKALDESGYKPRMAMWVHNSDVDTWKLWIVPPAGKQDKAEFYRRIATIVSQHQSEFNGIDSSDTVMVLDSHPAMKGLGRIVRATGQSAIHFGGNRFNGFYLPDGIILRADMQPQGA